MDTAKIFVNGRSQAVRLPKAYRLEVYGTIRSRLEKQGKPIGPLDCLIAAHALSRGLILITNNEKEFARIQNLRIENWLQVP